MPSDLATHISHSNPQVNFNTVSAPSPLDLNNLNQLGGDVYLTSKDDITTNPAWLKGVRPDGSGKTDGSTAAVIVNDKGNGNVDAFYMYFYSYNWGGEVLGLSSLNFGMLLFPGFSLLYSRNLTSCPGNHVGDWEHTMVRFSNGNPEYVWYSQHANGQAFKYGRLTLLLSMTITHLFTGIRSQKSTLITCARSPILPTVLMQYVVPQTGFCCCRRCLEVINVT